MRRPFTMALLALACTLRALPATSAELSAPFLLDLQSVDPAVVARDASNALTAPVIHITEKAHPSPSGDPHDYVSYARYWWPDPASSNGLPFIRRDGDSNREQVDRGDRSKINQLTSNTRKLALGWHFEHQTNCATRAGQWLRAWFVAPATRMNPSLDYAQVRLGHDGNRGSNFGIIDTRGFAGLVDSICLLTNSPALSQGELGELRQWFAEYLNWLLSSEKGRLEREAPNNHGSWYLVQTIAIARFLGEDEQARALALENRGRIAWQFDAEGRQPLELARVNGLGYSVFNLQAQFQIATLSAPLGVDFWNYVAANGASLQKGLRYLRPYNLAPQDWPHNQRNPLEPGFLQPLLDRAARIWQGEETKPSPAPSENSSSNVLPVMSSKVAGAQPAYFTAFQ